MNESFSRYLTVLIAKDLEGKNKDLPSYMYEVIETYFARGNFKEIESFLNTWLSEGNK